VKLRYTPQARLHLDAIAEYVGAQNPAAARRIGARIEEMTDSSRSISKYGS
jgi:plasmid stabilization system protein ParE